MGLELTIVDAFTDRAFAGNPAAVCVLDGPFPADARMQAIAAEVNLSETAFCAPSADGRWDLRWFTPTVEVPLCGHATLATVAVLGGAARFTTASGELGGRVLGDGRIEIDLPIDRPRVVVAPPTLERALRTQCYVVARTASSLLVEVESAAAVRALAPDLAAIAALDGDGVIVTAPGDAEGLHCVSRYFAPAIGIPEDPVTGAAHCALAPFWGERLDRTSLTGEQASPRGGRVEMHLAGDRVLLVGHAVKVASMRLLV